MNVKTEFIMSQIYYIYSRIELYKTSQFKKEIYNEIAELRELLIKIIQKTTPVLCWSDFFVELSLIETFLSINYINK